MDEREALARRFEENRARLRAMAHRMLGSQGEADDAVQEAWLRLSRTDASTIEGLGPWLTTVVARVCLDLLRARKARREDAVDGEGIDALASVADDGVDLEKEALLADSIGPALLVVLETLTPAERLSYVLHDMFAVPFEEIAGIAGRSPAATRQLASRARRRVQGAAPGVDADRRHKRAVIDAFLGAARGGDFGALLALLDPQVVVRSDAGAQAYGALAEERGAAIVATTYVKRARGALSALIDGRPAAVWAPRGRPRVVFDFTVVEGRITALDLIGDAARLRAMDVVVLESEP